MSGHLAKIRALDGTDDVRADMQRSSHGDEVYPPSLTGLPKEIPI